MRLSGAAGSRAVLIGVGKYLSDALTDVPQVKATVEALSDAICDPRVGSFLPEHCRVLLDEHDKRTIGRALHQMADEAVDTLLVYYTGHGIKDEKTFDLYLGLPGTEECLTSFSALAYAAVRDAVTSSRARRKVIILDCCFSGRAVNQALSDQNALIRGQLDVEGAVVLTSASGNQVALVLQDEPYTAFTGRLIALLRDGVPDGPEEITVGLAFEELTRCALKEGLPKPYLLAKQNAASASLAHNRALLPERSNPRISPLAEFAARWRRPSALLEQLRSECSAATDRLNRAMPEPFASFAPDLKAAASNTRDIGLALFFGVAWVLVTLTRAIWCALSVLRNRNQSAFNVVLALVTVCAAASIGAMFSTAPAAAATCSYTQSISATDAATVTVSIATARADYEAVFRTTAGQFTLKALSSDHPCAAYALRYLITHGFYNGQQCAYFDETTSGYVLDCFDPSSPPSSTGLSFTPDSTSLPSTSNGLVLMWTDAGDQAEGILAFSGNDPAPTNSYEACAQIIAGGTGLDDVVRAGYHTGFLDVHTFANKPFTIKSVSLLQAVSAVSRSASAAAPHS